MSVSAMMKRSPESTGNTGAFHLPRTYYRFLQVYDYFAGKGWASPDGNASPCLLMIDFSGESDGNAYYGGFRDGCHYFCFGTNDYASQSIQVIAH